MNRRNIHVKTKCGQHTCKALSNYESFSPSQFHAPVPLNQSHIGSNEMLPGIILKILHSLNSLDLLLAAECWMTPNPTRAKLTSGRNKQSAAEKVETSSSPFCVSRGPPQVTPPPPSPGNTFYNTIIIFFSLLLTSLDWKQHNSFHQSARSGDKNS